MEQKTLLEITQQGTAQMDKKKGF